jgi:hypothetical protein
MSQTYIFSVHSGKSGVSIEHGAGDNIRCSVNVGGLGKSSGCDLLEFWYILVDKAERACELAGHEVVDVISTAGECEKAEQAERRRITHIDMRARR